jgi:hypothetical protein
MNFLKTAQIKLFAVAIVAASVGLGAGVAVAGQPNMQGALSSLESAQDYLSHVTQDKGGHANAARRLVAQAIEQVNAGIAYGQAHGE